MRRASVWITGDVGPILISYFDLKSRGVSNAQHGSDKGRMVSTPLGEKDWRKRRRSACAMPRGLWYGLRRTIKKNPLQQRRSYDGGSISDDTVSVAR